jgi:type IV pilus assembly protein PilY1
MKTPQVFLRAGEKSLARLKSIARAVTISSLSLVTTAALAQTPLANQPLLTVNDIPGNLALALSVEYPTAISVAHISGTYTPANTYLGYFDPGKCYTYRSSVTDSTVTPNTTTPDSYFYPDGLATATHTCTSKWSGNFLNWATMQTIDPFRWALTGGYRVIDSPSLTVLEKAWGSAQGNITNFPLRSITNSGTLAGATPLGWSNLTLDVWSRGNKLRFYRSGVTGTPAHYGAAALNNNTVYEVFVRAKVCDPSAGAGGLETNCRRYGSNYKPEGLIQNYANKIRYSAFGYLNDGSLTRDGAALRARQKFVGPLSPVPGSTAVTNVGSEWDANTGVFIVNPDPADATDTATIFGPIANSGVMNYLNKFGLSGTYKTYDPVGELYYAAVRYFKNLGNVPEWTAVGSANAATRATWADRFPVIRTWDDPILYSCQRNFILGIGDTNSHADANVPRTDTPAGGSEPPMPSAVSSDTSVANGLGTVEATNRVGTIQGMGGTLGTLRVGSTNKTMLMAGLAYDSHTLDIRPDVVGRPNTLGKQTISTYWLDVQEYQALATNNQFMLAAKFGGFTVPDGYVPYAQTAALPDAWWTTTGEILSNGQPRPDNYFLAGAPDKMVDGLNRAFADIANRLSLFSTSFSLSSPQITSLGNMSFSARYDSSSWTSEIRRDSLDVVGSTNPTTTVVWSFPGSASTQFGNTGWNTTRRVVTWNPSAAAGVPFRIASLSSSQTSALDTLYVAGDDSTAFLNYLRGDRTNEQASTVSGSTRAYRTRNSLLGDIVDSQLVPVGKPAFPWDDISNPGYSAFKTLWANRPTVVYVGANDGMLHAINATNGTELFAYVPSALFNGPNGTPAADGLAALGNPTYSHRYFVNSTPTVFDIDLAATVGSSARSADWRSVLVGGLGKGGKSYYAIDVTDPSSMTSETAVAGKVMWEFTDPDMGYTYDGPVIAKTRKYGWVFVFTSGYNNADGRGYLFFVNPRTGALLEKITTGVGTPANSAGLAYANGYVRYYGEQMIDTVYAGDLLGNLWRLDVTAASGNYPAPELIARLTDATGNAQPVTSRPVIETDVGTRYRYIFVGTGRLLDASDIASTRMQSFYAIRDGNNVRFNRSTDPGVTFPITPGMLSAVVDPLTGAPGVPATGWFINQGTNAGGLAWRSVIRPNASYPGLAIFTSILLTNSDVCLPSGQSRIYALKFANGQSELFDRDPNGTDARNAVRQAYLGIDGIVTGTFVLGRSNGTGNTTGNGPAEPIFIGQRNTGDGFQFQVNKSARPGLRRMNWREIPVAD